MVSVVSRVVSLEEQLVVLLTDMGTAGRTAKGTAKEQLKEKQKLKEKEHRRRKVRTACELLNFVILWIPGGSCREFELADGECTG